MEVGAPNMTLLVFDFDDTLISANSDTYVIKLCKNGKVPDDIEKSNAAANEWVTYMDNIMEHLHQTGVSENQILSCIDEIPLVEDIAKIFEEVRRFNDKYQVVIISDANSVFINHILESKGIKDLVKEVFTNPATFDENGQLRVKPYHDQDWCKLSSRNLCKGYILEEFLKKQKALGIVYERVAYVGDGNNDFCPGLRLSEKDFLFPRKGYNLVKAIARNQKTDEYVLKANVHPWSTGSDILKVLKDKNWTEPLNT